jgi:hypothetical protein
VGDDVIFEVEHPDLPDVDVSEGDDAPLATPTFSKDADGRVSFLAWNIQGR